MRAQRWYFGGLCLSLLLIANPGCSNKDDNPAAPTLPTPTEIEQVVEQAGTLQRLCADKDVVTDADTVDAGAFRTVTESHDAARNIQEITYLGLNDDIIWTGNLIKGEKLHQFVYEPVVGVARTPVTLSINLEGSGSGTTISEVVSDPKLSTIRQGISALLERAIQSGTTYAARAQFDRQQVYCESQLNLVVGADLKYGAGSVGTTFEWSSTTRKNKIIAKYQQLYYTIDMDTPTSPAAVFASSNTLEQIRAAIPPGSCPVYVAGVTYGMMALIFIETDYTETEMKASLDAAYSGGVLDVEVRSGLTKRQVLENSGFKTIVYGGASAGLQQIYTGWQGFTEVVSHSIQLGLSSPGVPLIYKFRHLRDNNLADVTLTSQYALTRTIRLQQAIRITANKLVCEARGEDCACDDLNPDINRVMVKANIVQRTSPTDPGVNYCLADTTVFDGPGYEMGEGSEYPMGTSMLFELDAEHFDYQLATIKLVAYLHEDDTGGFPCYCDDDQVTTYVDIPAGEFLANPHSIIVNFTDARFRFEVSIDMANAPQLSARRMARRR